VNTILINVELTACTLRCPTESHIQCDLNVSSSNEVIEVQEADVVKVECRVNYRGSWSPVIKCNHSRNVTNVNISSYGVYSALVNIQRNMTNSKIQCETYFDGGLRTLVNISRTSESNNVPEFTSVWNSPIFRVGGMHA
jgi:hypothetical protein